MIPLSDQPERPRRTVPIVVPILIALNILVFVYELALGPRVARLVAAYGVIPYEITTGRDVGGDLSGPVYVTLLTAMFLHGGFLHLGGNMLFLWIFGDNVEDSVGHLGFLVFYLLSGVAASFAQIATSPLSQTPSLGASGAIAGVLAAYLLLFPRAQVRTLLVIFPFVTVTRLSAVFLIGVWFVLQIFNGLLSLEVATEQTSGVAFWAHVGGFVAGLIMIGLVKLGGKR